MTNNPRYAAAIASIKMMKEAAALDMTQDDFAFFTANRMWTSIDRNRARRCVEAAVYGTLDFCGYPRFAAPAEFIAAAIAFFVHPVNIQTACMIMDGAEFSENMINGIERTLSSRELFAFTLQIRGGNEHLLHSAEDAVNIQLKMGAI